MPLSVGMADAGAEVVLPSFMEEGTPIVSTLSQFTTRAIVGRASGLGSQHSDISRRIDGDFISAKSGRNFSSNTFCLKSSFELNSLYGFSSVQISHSRTPKEYTSDANLAPSPYFTEGNRETK